MSPPPHSALIQAASFLTGLEPDKKTNQKKIGQAKNVSEVLSRRLKDWNERLLKETKDKEVWLLEGEETKQKEEKEGSGNAIGVRTNVGGHDENNAKRQQIIEDMDIPPSVDIPPPQYRPRRENKTVVAGGPTIQEIIDDEDEEDPTQLAQDSHFKTLTSRAALLTLELIFHSISHHASSIFHPSNSNTDPSSSTSASTSTQIGPGPGEEQPETKEVPPPLFGMRDKKVITTLAGIISKWGLNESVSSLTSLSSQTPNDDGKKKRVNEKRAELLEMVVSIDRMLLSPLSMSFSSVSSISPPPHPIFSLRSFCLPSLQTSLLQALLYLAFSPSPQPPPSSKLSQTQEKSIPGEKQKEPEIGTTPWCFKSIFRLLDSLSPSITLPLLSSLLSSLPNNQNKSQSSNPIRSLVSNLLSSQLLRPGGVRALIGLAGNETVEMMEGDSTEDGLEEEAGSEDAAGNNKGKGKAKAREGLGSKGKGTEKVKSKEGSSRVDEMGGVNELERWESVAGLLSSPPGGMEERKFMPLIISRLLSILIPATNPNSPSPPPPPASIIRVTCFCLSSISQRHPEFFENLVEREKLWDVLIPGKNTSDSKDSVRPPTSAEAPPRNKTEDQDSFDPEIITSQQLDDSLSLLSLLIHNSPPSSPLPARLLKPILPALVSLYLYLGRTKGDPVVKEGVKNVLRGWTEMAREEGGGDSGNPKKGSIKGKEREREMRRTERAREMARAMEVIEERREFGEVDDEHGGRLKWARSGNGGVCISQVVLSEPPLPFDPSSSSPNSNWKDTNPSSAPLNDSDADDISASTLGLVIDPKLLIEMLRDISEGKDELEKDLVMRSLGEVRILQDELRNANWEKEKEGVEESEEDVKAAKKVLFRFQFVLKSIDISGPSILEVQNPSQIIIFVKWALETAATDILTTTTSPASKNRTDSNEFLDGVAEQLKEMEETAMKQQVELENEVEGGMGESINLGTGLGLGLGKDELVTTALTLLLAVLEAQEDDLSPECAALLSSVPSTLEIITSDRSTPSSVRQLAKSTRFLLSLKSMSSESRDQPNGKDGKLSNSQYAKSRGEYQLALKLLQDQVLPVRAQGLAILRQLLVAWSRPPSTDKETPQRLDPVYFASVLEIFLQSVEDEDSFIYLGAVQGLRVLVTEVPDTGETKGWGREALRRLVGEYTGSSFVTDAKGESGLSKEQWEGEKGIAEMDRRLRIGEALGGIVDRLGKGVGGYVETIVPPLLEMFRSSRLPTLLRISALTLLSTCAEISPLALKSHSWTLVDGCLDLLSLESRPVPGRHRPRPDEPSKVKIEEVEEEEDEDGVDRSAHLAPKRPEETTDPLAADRKHPALRRAAILFVGLLLRSSFGSEQRSSPAKTKTSINSDDGISLPVGGIRMPWEGSSGGVDYLLSAKEVRRNKGGSDFPVDLLKRMRRVLGYVGEIDEDSLVRYQATQVLEDLEEL